MGGRVAHRARACAGPSACARSPLLLSRRRVRQARLPPARAAAAPRARAAAPQAARAASSSASSGRCSATPTRWTRASPTSSSTSSSAIYASAGARVAFYASARNIYLDRPFGDGGFYPRLAELEPPALFVWGTHDKLIPAGFRRHVAEALPGAEQVVLDGCGHVPQVERPEQTGGHAAPALRADRGAGRPLRAPRSPRVGLERARHGAQNGHRRACGARTSDDAHAQRGAWPTRSPAARRPRRPVQPRPAADLDERDPDYIRETLPRMWLLSSLYFRGEVRGPGQHPRRRARCCWSATTRAAT